MGGREEETIRKLEKNEQQGESKPKSVWCPGSQRKKVHHGFRLVLLGAKQGTTARGHL